MAERPRRGDVWWVDCDPSIGAEPTKTRCCVVVSNDFANRHGRTVTVVPTLAFDSDRAARVYMVDLRPPVSDVLDPRVANASAPMTYDRARLKRRAGRVGDEAMAALDKALRLHLALE